MIRKILAVIAGSALWTVLWFGCNALLKSVGLLPAFDGSARFNAPLPLGLLLLSSIVFSVLAGYTTAALAGGDDRSRLGTVWVLAVLQLLFGIFAQAQFWNVLPLWYHLLFLLALVPATIVGGRLRVRTR
jgi:hypothetical protein